MATRLMVTMAELLSVGVPLSVTWTVRAKVGCEAIWANPDAVLVCGRETAFATIGQFANISTMPS